MDHWNKLEDDRGRDMRMIKTSEIGRSMVEMLGTLAVIGVLSVVGVVGYTYAMEKHYTNDLLSGASARAVLVEAQIASGKTVTIAEFEQYKETAGGTIEGVEVFQDNSFGFTVTNVKGSVCELVIETVEDSKIRIMKDEGESLTDMTESDCDFENPNHFMIVYEVGEGIKCDPEKALSCMDESGNGWCCGAGLICDIENQGCKDGGGACQYNFTQQVYTRSSNCSYIISTQEQTRSYNCHYTVRDYVIEGSLHGVEMREIKGCPSGQYCLLGYFDDECSSSINRGDVGASGAEDVYGVCLKRTMNGGTCDVSTVSTAFMDEVQGCPTGEYCLISYFDEECTSSINRGDVGATTPEQVYGVCLKRTMNGGTCDVAEIAEGSLTEVQGCPAGQYCYLKWQGSDCSTAINKGDVTGPMFGACLERTSTNAQCPIK